MTPELETNGLKGKTALVTGGSRRIGRAICLALAKSGINCIIHYHRSEENVLQTVDELRACNVDAWTVQVDFSDISQVPGFFDSIPGFSGTVDFLINNASVFPVKDEKSLSTEDQYAMMTINAFSPYLLAQEFAGQTDEGAVVNLLDARIAKKDLKRLVYQASKTMLYQGTFELAKQLAPQIRVNGIAPGLILPPDGKDNSYMERFVSRNLLGKTGSTEDIAQAVLFLLSSPFITGEVLFVDGGEHLKGAGYCY